MPVTLKDIHMATNLSELQEKSSIDKKYYKKEMNVTKFIEGANKLYTAAKELIEKEEKDEELVYMYLFRAMELWTIILTNKEVQADKKYFNLMHGKTMQSNIDLLDMYTTKLQMRYAALQKGVEEEKADLTSQFKLNTSVVTKKRKEKSIAEDDNTYSVNGLNKIPDERNKEHYSMKIKPALSVLGNEPDYYEENKFIQCEVLRDKVMAPSFYDVLIIDIRPRKDFDSSRIINVHCVNIPETCITAGLSANKLGETITNEDEKHYWKHRDQYNQLVLMDWRSEEKDVIPNTPLSNLQTILIKWDPYCFYKNKPLILNGGFEHWLDTYPTFTTNSKIERPPKSPSSKFVHLSEHVIEYPMHDLEEIISPKPKPAENPTKTTPAPTSSTPLIDRTTKPAPSTTKTDELPLPDEKPKPETRQVAQDEPMEEDKDLKKDENLNKPPAPVSQPKPKVQEMRPSTPPRVTLPMYPSTPKKTGQNGGDGDIFTDRLKFDSASRSGGLKRSASSPNINKLTNEENTCSQSVTPIFDRSTKPKSNYESPRATGTDTVYFANNKEGRGLTGLKNLGNLCYMNSIMQCMSNTVPLTQELTRFNVKETIYGRRQIASEVCSLLRTLWQGDTRLTSCRNLKNRVGVLKPSFSTMEQQDSHEFLTLLIDWLHEDLNEVSPTRSLDGAEEATGEKAWGEFRMKNNSVVLDLFYGQLKSTVTCNHCHKQSILFEPFSNLSVPLPAPQDTMNDKDRTFSLQDCLMLYLKGETISGWVCPQCKTPREATKKLDITRLPPILIIHLKRFMSDMVGVGWCRKRMNMVEFPINDFDMKRYTHPSSELRFHNYNLYAVSNHYGSMESGHYTAYCKNHSLNKWYKFDDHDVNEMSPMEVRTSAAYILFYESCQLERSNRMLD